MGAESAKKLSSTIKLEATDARGKRHPVLLRARLISARKQEEQPDDADQGPMSNADDEEYVRLLTSAISREIVEAPYPLKTLTMLKESSTELSQCVEAMVTNTVGFGYRLRERRMAESVRKTFESEIAQEHAMLQAMLETVHPVLSLTALRERQKNDQHSNGNGYLELIEDRQGRLVSLNHVRSHLVRMTPRERRATRLHVPRVRPDLGFKIETVPMWYRFRRFVLMQGRKALWFKEAGDPRIMDKRTGKFDNSTPFHLRATSLVHFPIYSAASPYGVPKWVGNLFSVYGSRAAEEINYNTLNSNAIPSMFVIIENGALTEASIERLQEWTEEQIQRAMNYSKFLLLEGETLNEGAPNPTNFKIRVEPLKQLQQDDQLFQKYDANNREKIRQAFRLPPIFVGRCHSDDTEFLTKRGWKLYSEIADGETVATKNPSTGALEFQVPTARHHYPFKGSLLHLRNRGIDAMVTPNHRMWVRPTVAKNRAEKPWAFVGADSLLRIPGGNGGYLELPVSASWDGEELRTFTIPRNDGEASRGLDSPTKNRSRDEARHAARAEYEVPGDEFVKFLGYFVSEGSTTETPGPITLSQNAGEVANRMVAVLRGLGFDPGVTESRPGQLKIGICHVGLWAWLREHCGTASSSKRLPAFVLDLCQRQLELLLDSMVDGDGSLPQLGSDGSFTYSTTSSALNDQLHVLCLKLGIALTSRRVDRSADGWGDIWCSYGHYADRHLIDPRRQINEVPYSGVVVCFTVPNGLLVTRRNGRVLISGNSDDYTRATADTSRDIGDEQVFAPERSQDDHLIQRFVLSRWSPRFHVFRSNHPNITDDIELIRMMAVAERSGAMTPRRANRIVEDVFGDDIGPMPTGIDLDKPFSISFAEAQQGAGGGPESMSRGGDPAQRMVESLVQLRGRVEKEIEDRWFNEYMEE